MRRRLPTAGTRNFSGLAHRLKGRRRQLRLSRRLTEACKALEDAAKARRRRGGHAALDAVAALAKPFEQGYTAPTLAEANPS